MIEQEIVLRWVCVCVWHMVYTSVKSQWGQQMAQWGNMFVEKPDDSSSISRRHVTMDGEYQLHEVVLWPSPVGWGTRASLPPFLLHTQICGDTQ